MACLYSQLQRSISVVVLDCNDPPSEIIFNSSLSSPDNVSYTIVIPENSQSGTSVVTVTVVDEDVGQQHNCILQEAGQYFYVNSLSTSSSEIHVRQGANLDYKSLFDSNIQGVSHVSEWYCSSYIEYYTCL